MTFNRLLPVDKIQPPLQEEASRQQELVGSAVRTDREGQNNLPPLNAFQDHETSQPITLRATLNLEGAARQTWDVLVIGAGPAGALAARRAARAGARVLLVERKTFPRWKVCGACVNAQALSVLDGVGLGGMTESLGAIPLNEFRLRAAGREARLRLPGGVCVSRARFDAALAQAAIDAGSEFLPNTQAYVDVVAGDCRRVTLQQRSESATVNARVVLAAAGLGNDCLPSAQRLQSVAEHSRIGAGGTVTDFPDYYARGTIFMAVGRNGYLGLVRQEDDTLNVAAAFDKAFLAKCGSPSSAASALLREAGFPDVSSLGTTPWQGTVSLTRHPLKLADERLFMLGDASGYVEPFTGEGIAWALAAAVAVTPLAMQGAMEWNPELPQQWSNLSGRLIGRRQRLCRFLAGVLRSPLLVRAAIGLLSVVPALATPLVARLNASAASLDTRDS